MQIATVNARIGKTVGAVLGKRKMAKHLQLTITDVSPADCRLLANLCGSTQRNLIDR